MSVLDIIKALLHANVSTVYMPSALANEIADCRALEACFIER